MAIMHEKELSFELSSVGIYPILQQHQVLGPFH